MATLIGLCLRVKLLRSLPPRFKVDILITPGTHSQEEQGRFKLMEYPRWRMEFNVHIIVFF
jgi:hypothetical protein